MTKEEKQLLLADLCARLPYGVMCDFAYNPGNPQKLLYVTPYDEKEQIHLDNDEYVFGSGKSYGPSDFDVEEVKPYLRPMSSMTEEECKELGELSATIENIGETLPNTPYYIEVAKPEQIDWLLSHHFDFRGLIPTGLALEAPERMYK